MSERAIVVGMGRTIAMIEAFRFGRSLAGISKRSLVAAVQSLFRSSKPCNDQPLNFGGRAIARYLGIAIVGDCVR